MYEIENTRKIRNVRPIFLLSLIHFLPRMPGPKTLAHLLFNDVHCITWLLIFLFLRIRKYVYHLNSQCDYLGSILRMSTTCSFNVNFGR